MSYDDEYGSSEWNANLEVLQRFQKYIEALDSCLVEEDLDLAFKYVENLYYMIIVKVLKVDKRNNKEKSEKDLLEGLYKKVKNLHKQYTKHDSLYDPLRDTIRELQKEIVFSADIRGMMNVDKGRDTGL